MTLEPITYKNGALTAAIFLPKPTVALAHQSQVLLILAPIEAHHKVGEKLPLPHIAFGHRRTLRATAGQPKEGSASRRRRKPLRPSSKLAPWATMFVFYKNFFISCAVVTRSHLRWALYHPMVRYHLLRHPFTGATPHCPSGNRRPRLEHIYQFIWIKSES
jgi:hypothetical protein